jgi:cytochrome c-type biogenesis protein
MLAATAADTTVLAAFAVGFVSFISPCVLPLVPGYLSAVSGVSITEMREGQHTHRVVWGAAIFCLSFTIVFVLLGATATSIGQTLNDHKALLDKIAGGVIIAMGVLFLLTPLIPRLNKEWRPDALISRAGSGGPLVAGAAFAFAWTPCIGPTLSSILAAAAISGSRYHGMVLLAFYSAGLAVPFLLTAILFNRATGAFKFIRDHYSVVTAVSGLILVVMGVMIFTNEITRLNNDAQNFLGSLGLDFIYNL